MSRKFYCWLAASLFLALLYFAQQGYIIKAPLGTILYPINNRNYSGDNIETTSQRNPRWFFNNVDVRQNDPAILNYLRGYRLTPPSKEPYNLSAPQGDPSYFKDLLRRLFGNKRNGFFIECGANDGEMLSNTLALERDQNWTGLLIETNRFIVPALRQKNRKAWIADVCLSLKPYPQEVKFLHRSGAASWKKGMGIIDEGNASSIAGRNPKNYVDAGPVDCFPLFSLLSAINVTRVDYFSLDVEGVEFKVLQTIPFDALDIRVISIESNLIPEGIPALLQFMKSKGFRNVFQKYPEMFFVNQNGNLGSI